jgi:hypothetical protein
MTGMLVFSTRLFGPSSLRARVPGSATGGAVSLSGEQAFSESSGGGRVVADFGDANMRGRVKMLAWERIANGAKSGASPILMPFGQRLLQPVNPEYLGTDTFGLETWIDDPLDWAAEEVTAVTTVTAALGATQLSYTLTSPIPQLGGEWISIPHATWGWRAYKAWRLVSGGAGTGDATVVKIVPPLREAVASGSALNLESPRCTMQSVGDISQTIDMLKQGKAQASFVEFAGKP